MLPVLTATSFVRFANAPRLSLLAKAALLLGFHAWFKILPTWRIRPLDGRCV